MQTIERAFFLALVVAGALSTAAGCASAPFRLDRADIDDDRFGDDRVGVAAKDVDVVITNGRRRRVALVAPAAGADALRPRAPRTCRLSGQRGRH
jgi:hypothetical protein